VLRRIFGPKREELAGVWKRLHNEELHNLYALLNIITAIKSRRLRWMGHIARMRQMRSPHIFWLEDLKEKSLLRRSKRKWKYNIRMDLREIGWEFVDWMHRSQVRGHWRALVNTEMNLRVP
jgi:hypothetical protein